MTSDPVLISGAGPAGLILALSLAKHGVSIRIVDKEPGPKLGERGVGIMPRTLEVHRLLGTLPDILSRATGVPVIRQYDPADPTKVIKTTVLIPTLEPTPQIPYINPVLLGQPYQELIFVSNLKKLGVSVEFGSELRSFKQIGDCVVGEIIRRVNGEEVVEEFKAPWLIGTDGAHSVVRKTLGLSFLGETREGDNIVLADVKVKGEKLEFWDRWGEPTTKMAHLRSSGQDDQIAQLIMAGAQVDAVKISTNRETIIEGKGYSDDSEVAARPGDRAPEAPGLVDASDKTKTASVHDIFSAIAHTILVFSDMVNGHSALFQVVKRLPEGTVRAVLILPKGSKTSVSHNGVDEQFDQILLDNEGYAYAGYHIDQAALAIIRPDGVVGARILGVSGVERYFKGIFA